MPKEYSTPGPRAIYPEMCDSRSLAKCGVVANALWPRMIVQADDQGRLAGDAVDILGLCFSKMLDKVTLKQVRTAIEELEGAGQIERYEADGEPYIQILTWWSWQGSMRRAYPSRHPAPTDWDDYVYGYDSHPKTLRDARGIEPYKRTEPDEPEHEQEDESSQEVGTVSAPSPQVADSAPTGSPQRAALTRARPRVRGARPGPADSMPDTPKPPQAGARPSRADRTNPRAVAQREASQREDEAKAKRWRVQQRQLAYARGAITEDQRRAMNKADTPLEEIDGWREYRAGLQAEMNGKSPLDEATESDPEMKAWV